MQYAAQIRSEPSRELEVQVLVPIEVAFHVLRLESGVKYDAFAHGHVHGAIPHVVIRGEERSISQGRHPQPGGRQR